MVYALKNVAMDKTMIQTAKIKQLTMVNLTRHIFDYDEQ